MKNKFMYYIISALLAGALLIAIPLHRIARAGEPDLSIIQKVTLGYRFPPQTTLDTNYKFKDGDVLVMYRPSCPDCQKYIGKIMDIVGREAIYLCDKSKEGKTLYDPDWVPSVIFFKDGKETVVEIRDDQDLVVLEEKVESFHEKLK